jgi:hypothetical protein
MKTYYKNLPLDAGVGDAPDRVVPGDHLKAFLFLREDVKCKTIWNLKS